ncbi:hypothetical protein B0T17DRAFT_497883, partial [Bombardia bombarda]
PSVQAPYPVFWPRDLLLISVPHARTMTYGYDTHPRHAFGSMPLNKTTVYDIARDFLVALEVERRLEPLRPVVFIAHSLGGIIVKEMLRQASLQLFDHTDLYQVFSSTVGIVFFGTPHGGADPSGVLQHVAETIIKAVGISVSEQIVNALLPSSERLRELMDEFGPIAQRQQWMVHSFQEGLGIKVLNGRKVVEDTSSFLNCPSIERTQHIERNHMDMCRFAGFDDISYKSVIAAINRIISEYSSRKPSPRTTLNNEEIAELQKSLRFDQMDSRHMSIEIANPGTCAWIMESSPYLDWLDASRFEDHGGFLWIKGKPGAGKSTIMKYILANARKSMRSKTILHFFFHARGSDLEKSTAGMYRSLLVQLLSQLTIPTIRTVAENAGIRPGQASTAWSIFSLKQMLAETIKVLGQHSSVACFIDALDECDEDQIRDMVAYLQHLGDVALSVNVRLHVMFASRHYPHITIRRGNTLTLENHQGHSQDIITYIDRELRIGQGDLTLLIRAELQRKASGVFMWVVLVVDMLNKEHDRGRTPRRLQRTLEDIPGDLHELFRDILTRDCRDSNELLLCIQWVLFAQRSLTPKELYFAILSGTEPEDISAWDPTRNETSLGAIKRFILNTSKGLAEITKVGRPTVQFIHESVKDFLLKDNGINELWPEASGGDISRRSNIRLAQCCSQYFASDVIARFYTDPTNKKDYDLDFPFLRYAIGNVLQHAEVAQAGYDNRNHIGTFIQDFPLLSWIKGDYYLKSLRKHRYKYTGNASLLYILAERNLSALIRAHGMLQRQSCFVVSEERYGPPILAALVTGSEEAALALLEIEAEAQADVSRPADPSEIEIWTGHAFAEARTSLMHASVGGHTEVVRLLLETGGVDLNAVDHSGYTALSYAAFIKSDKHTDIARLILAHGQVDVHHRDKSGRTALSLAAEKGVDGIVELLLATGKVNLDLEDSNGDTPWSWASRSGHGSIVTLLERAGCARPTSLK